MVSDSVALRLCLSRFETVLKFVFACNLQAPLYSSDSVQQPLLDKTQWSAPETVAVKLWTPNLGARVPTDLSTGVPDYSEYLESGLWCHRRRLRVVSGTDEATYEPQGARKWPSHFQQRCFRSSRAAGRWWVQDVNSFLILMSSCTVSKGKWRFCTTSWPLRKPATAGRC